jgi:ABC-2 type transport system ATP-binding protein
LGAIQLEKLTKYYGSRVGVDRLDLVVPEGRIFGFLGPNGSGKTTAIRLLMGFLRPDAGEARILGRNCFREGHQIRREVGYLPGDLRLYPWLTCRTALEICGKTRRQDLITAGFDLADELLLERDIPVRRMSHGTRQKLGLVLAMTHSPRLLILDEPTATLDPLVQATLFTHLRRLGASGHTVLFSTHVLSEVEELCESVAILRAGRLVEHASLSELRIRAGRCFTITWKSIAGPIPDPPDFLCLRVRESHRWSGEINGPAMSLIQWCSTQPVEDVSISTPDVSTVFRSYYARPEHSP